MRIRMSESRLKRCLDALGARVAAEHPLVATRFVQLGSKLLRVLVHDAELVPQIDKKLADMIKDYPFYKINLCRDIYRNVECLREFCAELRKRKG